MAGKILIVDDDRDITQIIQLLLEGEGYDTAVARRLPAPSRGRSG